MDEVKDVFDSKGNIVFLLDYYLDGYYAIVRGTESNHEVVKRSRSIMSLIEHVANTYPGDPQVELSEACEVIWSLEISDGQKWWHEMLDEECSE